MLHAGWRQYDRLGTKLLLFGTDPERAAALQYYVNFVRVLMSMESLPLTRLKTIHIAEHLVGLAQGDLGHSLAGESHCLSDVLKNHWHGFLDFSFSSFFQHHTAAVSSLSMPDTPGGVCRQAWAQRSKVRTPVALGRVKQLNDIQWMKIEYEPLVGGIRITAASGANSVEDPVVVAVNAEHQEVKTRIELRQLTDAVNPGQARWPDVHKRHVGKVARHALQRLLHATERAR